MEAMFSFYIKAGAGMHLVEAIAVVCGADVSVSFGGGQKCHIGASALAIPRPSLQDKERLSATASVICVTGHKDDELARYAALKLATALNCCVNVTVGLHVDGAVSGDINKLVGNFHLLLADVESRLMKEHATKQDSLNG